MMIHCIRWPPCELNISCTSSTAESRAKIGTSKMHLSDLVHDRTNKINCAPSEYTDHVLHEPR